MSEPFFGVDFGKDGTTYIVPAPGPITAACIEAAYQSAVADFGVDHSHDLDAWIQSLLPAPMYPQLLAKYEAYLQSERLAETRGNGPAGIDVDDRRKRPS
jgi:hypothetical protein